MTVALPALPFDDLPDADHPDVVMGELVEHIRSCCIDRPRNTQVEIGPSEAGNPCERAVLAQLAGEPDNDARMVNWKAEVGTALHSMLERMVGGSIIDTWQGGPRFLLEREITIGRYDGRTLVGHCDVFDLASGGTIDYKSTGRWSHTEHRRRRKMKPVYRSQAHLYGWGWEQLGLRVNWVADLYIPRDGEFSEIFWHAEPYDRSIALAALDRLDMLSKLLKVMGLRDAQALYEPCGDRWCRYCPAPRRFREPAVIDPAEDPFALPESDDPLA